MPLIEARILGYTFCFSYGDGLILNRNHAFYLVESPDKYNPALQQALNSIPLAEAFLRFADGYYDNPEDMRRLEYYAINLQLTEANAHGKYFEPTVLFLNHDQTHERLNKLVVKMQEKKRLEQEQQQRKFNPTQPTKLRGIGRQGFVYLVESPSGAYKIGRTKNPNDRARTFEVKLPFEINFVAVIQTDDMYQMEKTLHTKFNEKRINGEWFNLNPLDVEYIKGLANG